MRGARALKIDLRTTCKPKTELSDNRVRHKLQQRHPWKFVKFYVKYLVITSMLHTFYHKISTFQQTR